MIPDNIEGNVVVSASTVIHPKVKIIAEEGKSIIIGDGNVIEELCKILNSTIGNNNLIEVCTKIEEVFIFSFNSDYKA